jgi:hypothetical protein
VGGGLQTRSESEDFDADLVTLIGQRYPGNEDLSGKPLSHSLETAILNAVRRDGRKVLAGLIEFRAVVEDWTAEERKRIPPAEQWYSASEYLKDPAEWTLAQDGDSATVPNSLKGPEHVNN